MSTHSQQQRESLGGDTGGVGGKSPESPCARLVGSNIVPPRTDFGYFPGDLDVCALNPAASGYAVGLLGEWAVLRIRYEELRRNGAHSIHVNYAASAVAAKEREWLEEVCSVDSRGG